MISSLTKSMKLSWQRSREPEGAPFPRQIVEMAALMATTGLGPGKYHKYRLWQKDISWQEKKGYWHDQKYYAFLDRVNPHTYRIMARNKLLAKALLKFYAIPDADYIACITRNGLIATDGVEMPGRGGLEVLLKANPDLSRLCFKPVEGSGGDGFCAADVVRGDEILLRSLSGGEALTIPEFTGQYLNDCASSDFIVEKYLDQHHTLSELNPTSLNTLRVWVGRSQEGKVDIVGIYLRVGRVGSLVDNRLSGGFGVKVDPETFETQMAVPQDGSGQLFSCHPDSGIDMTNRRLPFREEVTALSKQVLGVLPSTRFVGLDIALTPDRPVIIEFNLAPTAIGACVLGKNHASLLGWVDESCDG